MTMTETPGRVRQIRPSVFVLDVGPVLTRFELDVLQRAADGQETAETARQLCYSTETVKSSFRGIYRKLNANNRTHAVAIAFRLGFIS